MPCQRIPTGGHGPLHAGIRPGRARPRGPRRIPRRRHGRQPQRQAVHARTPGRRRRPGNVRPSSAESPRFRKAHPRHEALQAAARVAAARAASRRRGPAATSTIPSTSRRPLSGRQLRRGRAALRRPNRRRSAKTRDCSPARSDGRGSRRLEELRQHVAAALLSGLRYSVLEIGDHDVSVAVESAAELPLVRGRREKQ